MDIRKYFIRSNEKQNSESERGEDAAGAYMMKTARGLQSIQNRAPTITSEQTTKILGKHLKCLKENKLEQFQKKLSRTDPPRGRKKITMRNLKNKSAEETAEIIVQSYTVKNGPPCVKKVLQEMNFNQMKIDLQKDLEEVKKKNQAKSSPNKVWAEGISSNKLKKKQLDDRKSDQTTNKFLQKEHLTAKTKAGISTYFPPKGKSDKRVLIPCPVQDDAISRMPTPNGNQGEPSNKALGKEMVNNGNAQMANLLSNKEKDGDVLNPDEDQEVSNNTTLISYAKQDNQESFRMKKDNSSKATQNIKNGKIQKQGDPKEDFLVGTRAEKIDAITDKLCKRKAKNGPMGAKQSKRQKKCPTPKPKQTASQQAKNCGSHFLDKHRSALISRVTGLDPVLDELLSQKILTQEKYDTVRKERTTQGKMRELFSYERSWGDEEKDVLLGLIKEHDQPVIKDLEKKEKKM